MVYKIMIPSHSSFPAMLYLICEEKGSNNQISDQNRKKYLKYHVSRMFHFLCSCIPSKHIFRSLSRYYSYENPYCMKNGFTVVRSIILLFIIMITIRYAHTFYFPPNICLGCRSKKKLGVE